MSSAARPPQRVRTMNAGSNPLDSLVRDAHQLGDVVPGPPAAMAGGARTRPDWFKNVGGGSPSEGFMGAVGVPPVSRMGPPAAAGMQASPDEEIPNTMGMMTNHSAPFMKISRAMRHDLMAVTQVYNILFAKQERQDPILKRRGRETRRYNLLNGPALNYFLRVSSPRPTSHNEVQSVQEFLDGVDAFGKTTKHGGWAIDGIVRTEEGAEDKYHRKEEVTPERGFNNVVRGFANTFNCFGPNATPGTPLFIIVKKVKSAKVAGFKVRPWSAEAELPISAGNRTEAPFQFEFFGDYRYDTPPLRELEYEDEFGYRHYGKAIYIGRVSTHAPVNPQYRDIKKCPYDLGAILTQPQFHIFVDW